MPIRRTSNRSSYDSGFYNPEVYSDVGGRIVSDFDPNVRNYINAVETADGQPLEYSVKVAYNNFVVGCKLDGIWDAIKASCILSGARTLSGALVPLVGSSPTNFSLSGYNRKTGLIGTASGSSRLDSNYVIPSANQNNTHCAAWVSTQMTAYGQILFGNDEGGYTGMYPSTVNQVVLGCNVGAGPPAVSGTGIGASVNLWAVTRNNSTSFDYKVSTFTGSISQASSTPLTTSICFFAGNKSPFFYPSNARIAFYSVGESLDLSLLSARVSTLVTQISNAIP